MAKPKVVKLGQKVFVLSEEGNIVRTMVAGIESDGDYRLLNGGTNYDRHWFSFDEALVAASEHLEARRAKLRKALRVLAAKGRELQSESYRSGVENAWYGIVDPKYDETQEFRPRTKKAVSVPKKYLKPGQCVFAIITPVTPSRYSWREVLYRPHQHFVLETSVKKVWFSPDGKVHYVFTTSFKLGEYFLFREEAEARLRSYSEPGTLEEVPFVSEAEETAGLEKLADDDVPF